MRIFLAGIMQGSHLGAVMHHQGYREQLKPLLVRHLPGAAVYDPLADNEQSLDYDADQAQAVFLHHNRMCAEVDVLIAFLPSASMGTAIEMWEAWRNGRIVLAISPLAHNWVVRFCSHAVYPDLETFAVELAAGHVGKRLEELRAGLPRQEHGVSRRGAKSQG
jgi:hypothetical protein